VGPRASLMCKQNVFNLVNDWRVTPPPLPRGRDHISDDELEILSCIHTSMAIGFYLTEQVTFIQY